MARAGFWGGCKQETGANVAVGGNRTGCITILWRSALLAIGLLSTTPAFAQDATWLANPGSADFNTASNWNPATVPTGTAFFNTSSTTSLTSATGTALGGLTLNAGAPNFTFAISNVLWQFNGAGIIINGGSATITVNNGGIFFNNSSTAGSATINGGLDFFNTSTAGSATLNNGLSATSFFNNSTAANAVINNNNLSGLFFDDNSTAGSATIINTNNSGILFLNSSTAGGATITNSSQITFENSGTAGKATITNNNLLQFINSSTAGNAAITNTGGATVQFQNTSTAGSAGIANNSGFIDFGDSSTAGSAAIANNGGEINFIQSSTAGGATITNNGLIFFEDTATGGTARLINGATGGIDLSNLSSASMSVGSIEGAGTISLGSKNLTVGGNNVSTTFSGVIGDGGLFGGIGGSLTKIGTGTLTLSGGNLYSGATIANGGTLEVDGSIATSSGVTVNSGGALSGIGNVSATTINAGGTLAPGNAANPTGTLAITGSLAFASGALYLVQVVNTRAAGTVVTGNATLGGATVDAIFAPGSSVAKQYIIVTAGSVSGTFNPNLVATNLPPGFSASLSYDATHAFLNLSLEFTAPGGFNGNQQAVANAISNFFNTTNGSIPPVFGGLTAAGLTQISGEAATGSQQTTFDAMGLFMGLLTDPFMHPGGGAVVSPGATGHADEEALGYAATKKTDAFAMFTKAPSAYEPRWSVWASGFGGSQSTSGNAVVGSHNTTSGVRGIAVGADYLVSPTTLAGFALAGGGTSFSVANGGTGRSDLFQAGAYLYHTNGPAYLSAALAYGWQDITTSRTVTIAGLDQLRAEFNANAYSGRLEGGYCLVLPATFGIGITPYAAAQFVTFDLPAYAEQAIVGTNNFAPDYGAKDATDVRSELGLRTDKSFALADGILTLRGRFAWAHDYDPDRSIAATFQSLPGASFVVNGAAQAADSALTTASIEMKWKNGWSVAATFEGEFSNVTNSYAGKGVVRYAW